MSVIPGAAWYGLNNPIFPIMVAGSVAPPATTIGYPSTISTVVGGLTSTSVVNVSYVHPGAGGAAQWISLIQPSTNFLTVSLGQNIGTGEYLNYIAKVQ